MSVPDYPPDPPKLTKQQQVEDWREAVLAQVGFSEADALILSRRRDVDVRAIERWRQQGCTIEQVLRIVRDV